MNVQLKVNINNQVQSLNFRSQTEASDYIAKNNIARNQIVSAKGFDFEKVVFSANVQNVAVDESELSLPGQVQLNAAMAKDSEVDPKEKQ